MISIINTSLWNKQQLHTVTQHQYSDIVQSSWTCISLTQARVFCFFAGGCGISNSNWHMWQWKEEAMLCKIHMRDSKSHFWQDFLAYCTGPISVHLAMACVGCMFNSFSIFLFSLKQQQSLMKIIFSCIHFLIWPYPPKNNEKKKVFYTSKLYGLTGMQWQEIQPSDVGKMFNTTKSSTAMSCEKCSTQHKVQLSDVWKMSSTTWSTAKWCVKNVQHNKK